MNFNSFKEDMLTRELAIINLHLLHLQNNEKEAKKRKSPKKVLKTIKTEIRLIKKEITKLETKKLFK